MTSDRFQFFDEVYENAAGEAGSVPWADLAPKDELVQWLAENPGINPSGARKRAIDVACGLGDNAEALAGAGYETIGFDYSAKAIDWARRRFPGSTASYETADLFDPPGSWIGTFDLVNECFTLQALPPEMLDRTAAAIAALVRPGGDLLVYTRYEKQGRSEGPPWPLAESRLDLFAPLGFETVSERRFKHHRPDGRVIPHSFRHWRKA